MAVIGVRDVQSGEAVKAVVVRKPGVNLTEKYILDYCRARIANPGMPRTVVFVAELPRSMGKVVKRMLRPILAKREKEITNRWE